MGVSFFYLKVNQVDTKTIADEEVDKLTNEDFTVQVPTISESKMQVDTEQTGTIPETHSENQPEDKSSPMSSNEESRTGDNKTQQKSSNKDIDKEESRSQSKTVSKSIDNKTLSVEEIKSQYRPAFKQLEEQVKSRLTDLLEVAFNEFKEKKDSGEKITFTYFYKKYTTASGDLESNTDKAFNLLYSSLQKDLKKHGHSKKHAVEFKDQYEEEKKVLKKKILSKAVDQLK
ncbi:hypothetical protein BSG1_20245 [Bacillus sp. SG-1]|nr:hypothetical protein BSG1_20245 [Bacillus sp. SG-1]